MIVVGLAVLLLSLLLLLGERAIQHEMERDSRQRRDRALSRHVPARCPLSGRRRCIRDDCPHWTRAAGCTHLEAVTKRNRRRR